MLVYIGKQQKQLPELGNCNFFIEGGIQSLSKYEGWSDSTQYPIESWVQEWELTCNVLSPQHKKLGQL